ncbi:MAG: hypothetical protein EP343_09515 [Deltaproteobacteria bacterium]|nr:MAG: hypothetical protein EP343_09515 [Deltaproteobacteria bacterium]
MRHRIILVGLLCSLTLSWVVACGGDVPREEFVSAYTRAFCDMIHNRCCTAKVSSTYESLLGKTMEECLLKEAVWKQALLGGSDPSSLDYNASEAGTCLRHFESISCNNISTDPAGQSCNNIWTGKLEEGESCIPDDPLQGTKSGCKPGTYCDPALKKCSASRKEGERCGQNEGVCGEGLYCSSETTCKPHPEKGEACNPSETFSCNPKHLPRLLCNPQSKVCEETKPGGESCTRPSECSTYNCVDGKCKSMGLADIYCP